MWVATLDRGHEGLPERAAFGLNDEKSPVMRED